MKQSVDLITSSNTVQNSFYLSYILFIINLAYSDYLLFADKLNKSVERADIQTVFFQNV
jgi:hypothetical protein